VSYTVGQVGQAADFERDNSEYLSISHSLQSGLAITGSLTLAGWVRLESINPNDAMIVASKYEYGVNNRAYRLDIRPDGIPAFIVSPDGSTSSNYNLVATTPLTPNTWYHLAAVFDSQAQTMALYQDGVLAATRSITFNTIYPSTAPFFLGTNLNNGSAVQFFDGLLDEWRVYARPLSQSEIQTLRATTPPTITFNAAPLSGTAPLTVVFTNTTSGTATYLWNFGDGLTSTLVHPTHTYSQARVYTVTLAATGAGGSDVLTKSSYITVSTPGIVVDFAAFPLSGPLPLLVQFLNNTTNASSYAWQFGDGITSTLPSPTHTYTAAGVYTVTLTASDGVNTVPLTRTNYITVSEPLAANFGATPLSGTAPLTVTFANSSTGASAFVWEFGNSITSTVISPTHTYTQAGVYTVTLIADDGTMTDTLTRSNYITVTLPISREWQQITTTTSPPVLGEHSLAYNSARNRVILYGGNADGWPYADATWEFDGTDWLTVTTSTRPNARYGTGLAYDPLNEVTVLFGGSDEDDTALNQTWEYTGTDWVQVFPTTSPLSRTYHSLATNPISGTIYLFGGNDGETYFSDLWKYENGDWTNITISGARPVSRTLAAITYDTDNNRLLLFGGRTVTGTLLADLWAFDPVAEIWTELDDGGGGPPARMAHSLTYDPATGNVVLVGGLSGDGDIVLNDTWHYNQNGWMEVTPSPAPAQPAYHQAVYGSNAIILFSKGEVWRYE